MLSTEKTGQEVVAIPLPRQGILSAVGSCGEILSCSLIVLDPKGVQRRGCHSSVLVAVLHIDGYARVAIVDILSCVSLLLFL